MPILKSINQHTETPLDADHVNILVEDASILPESPAQSHNKRNLGALIRGLLSRYYIKPTTGIPKTDLSDELQSKIDEIDDKAEQISLDAEITNRENADSDLQEQIDAEITNRENADSDLQEQIDAIQSAVITDAEIDALFN